MASSDVAPGLAVLLETAACGPVTFERRVAGGDINEAARGRLASGQPVFVKWNRRMPARMFVEEARGLEALRGAGGCRVPEVLGTGEGQGGAPGFLVLEWIEPGRPRRDHAQALARGLARQHRATAGRWGFESDNFIGSTPQQNGWMDDWVEFFRDRRLGAQQALLAAKGAPASLVRALDRVRDRLHEWLALPGERPALLHGDLWGGNALVDEAGGPVLIDPAVSYGCREADLAMTELFGGFPAGLIDAYREEAPLAPGYEERRDLYNLYHVCNHANLFGGGYVAGAERICRRYIGCR